MLRNNENIFYNSKKIYNITFRYFLKSRQALMILNKQQALEIALTIMPELNNKIIYEITDAQQRDTSLPADCWYIKYSLNDKSCAVLSGKSSLLALSKVTGELKYK